MKMGKFLTLSVSAAALLFATAAQAGEQYVDGTGYAVSGYDVVAYHGLSQSPIGTAQPGAVKGATAYSVKHNGATWLFSTAANRDAFVANPDKYAPAYDGHCAYGISRGGKVPANPNLWRIVDDKLYLNITKAVVGFWEEDVPQNIVTAENKWTALEAKPASTKAIPDF
jgi:YHS domain-containing protein